MGHRQSLLTPLSKEQLIQLGLYKMVQEQVALDALRINLRSYNSKEPKIIELREVRAGHVDIVLKEIEKRNEEKQRQEQQELQENLDLTRTEDLNKSKGLRRGGDGKADVKQ